MASSSLRNITVPLAGGQTATSQGLLMPKLKYRFRANFLNFGVSQNQVELTKQIADITRPNLNFNPFVIDLYNSKVNLIGKPEWQTVTINLRDDAQGLVSGMVGEQVQKQFDFAQQSSAASGIDYKFGLTFEMLDGGNGANAATVLETWEIYGAFIQEVNWGEMNYATSEAAMIALTIKYDNAEQTKGGTSNGVGKVIARTLGTTTTA
jgi:hypothetical protein